jgi:hypothetical protein
VTGRGPSLIEFTRDPDLLGLELSVAQEALLRAAEGLGPGSNAQDALYRQATRRTR